jgi:hypothetical protein
MIAAPPSAVDTAPSPALSPAQLKSQLWADDRVEVFAVVMGSRVPDLRARLSAALSARELQDFDCLRPGALPPAQQREAPYLVWLQRKSPFTDWLLFEAAAGLGEWGVVVISASPLLALRSHLRGLLAARVPTGQTISLQWMDPVILQALLPLFDAAGLVSFMGPVQALVVAGDRLWTRVGVSTGRLESHRLTVAAFA